PATMVATPRNDDQLVIYHHDNIMWQQARLVCQQRWHRTSYEIQKRRDNPECAQQELEHLNDDGLFAEVPFNIATPVYKNVRPKMAILREQGVNGHMEMAAAFTQAGFDCYDVHMTDIIHGRVSLDEYQALTACGGFSFGDVLGAGRGWANSIRFNDRAREQFANYFQRNDTLTLGVCNGCQMLSQLQEFIPGAENWPTFTANDSRQFEARLTMVEITANNSPLFADMAGAKLPIVVSHGEGKIKHDNAATLNESGLVTLRYLANTYPANPNGSAFGITGLCSKDGRVNIMMPHPERIFRTSQLSWHPEEWGYYSPWFKLFCNMAAVF
ncbi:MAG: phosphoribosylformylglycinamidine synthase subunit PurQ, partial [Coxiellaceae bacterium]|nr:phosphoribosylformylglycinamidine synthase subunit PurQ [Coxiellaceae bacterium]